MSSTNNNVIQKIFSKIEDAVKNKDLTNSLGILTTIIETLEEFNLKGVDKKSIAIEVLKKISESQVLPSTVNTEITFLINSNLMGGMIDVICKASKGLYDINKKCCSKLFKHKMFCCA